MALVKGSAIIPGLRGSMGNATFVQTPYGTSLRDRTRPKQPDTEGQVAQRARMRAAGQAWRSMTLAQAEAWRRYAASVSGQSEWRQASGQHVFTQLAIRFLMVSPTAEIPLDPPTLPFSGDGLTFSVERVSGGLRVTPSQPNTTGVVTEILLQPLASVHRRTYLSRYRSAAFHSFDGSAVVVPCPESVVAVAVRFVRVATGQATALMELGVM